MKQTPETFPVLTGIALLGIGLMIRTWQPGVLRLPEPDSARAHRDRGLRRAARKSRDGLAAVLPGNLTQSVARSLMIVGAGLLVVRALDLAVDDEEALF